jgi:hypothetical protein
VQGGSGIWLQLCERRTDGWKISAWSFTRVGPAGNSGANAARGGPAGNPQRQRPRIETNIFTAP